MQLGEGCLPLCAAADVIAVPGYTPGYVGIDTTDSQKGAGILDLNIFRCKEHGEADHCEQTVANHENPSLLKAIGEETP
jgi:hypothetical protein